MKERTERKTPVDHGLGNVIQGNFTVRVICIVCRSNTKTSCWCGDGGLTPGTPAHEGFLPKMVRVTLHERHDNPLDPCKCVLCLASPQRVI